MCEHAVERTPAVQNMSLIASGIPSSGPALPDAMRASEAFAMPAARSGVSSTKALSARAFSIAAMCAVASSPAEKDFFFSPSRASAKLSDVSSVTAWARPPIVARGLLAPNWRPRRLLRRQTQDHRWHSFSLTRCAPLPARQPSTSIRTHRRCTLLDHLRHQEKVVVARRRIFDDRIGDTAIGHRIGALFHGHRRHGRHRLDAVHVHLLKPLDEGEHGIELALEVVDLLVGHRDAGKVGDAAYGIGVDSH